MLSRLVVIILLVGSSCSESPSYSSISSHPYAAYFYKYDSIPKVYVYRDVIDGLKDYIVVEKDDVLMIYPKSKEQDIKQIVKKVKDSFDASLT